MLLSDGRVVLLDFGIARHLTLPSLTADIALFGPMTVGYAAPEQIKNEKRKICNRTDLFAWATVMYECITGHNPFIMGCSHQGEMLRKTLVYDPPILSGIKSELAQLIQDCLKKVIHRRPPSAAAVLKTLKNIGGA
jgi:serine/threonine-protein kinase